MASTNLTLERGVLWFEDGTEVSNVSVNSLKALPDLLAALKDAEKYIGALPKPSVKKDFSGLNHLEQTLKAVRAAISKATGCSYCGGNCPADEDNACDGYLGDVDGLDSEETCEHTGMTRDELESICGTDEPDEDGEGYDEDWEESLGRIHPTVAERHYRGMEGGYADL